MGYLLNQNDIACLSHYFDRKVSCPPYRPNAAKGLLVNNLRENNDFKCLFL